MFIYYKICHIFYFTCILLLLYKFYFGAFMFIYYKIMLYLIFHASYFFYLTGWQISFYLLVNVCCQ